MTDFIPDGFTPPVALDLDAFCLRPLGPEHNDADYAAWTSSMEHIRATPGFIGSSWPHPMSLDENRQDLVRHAADFAARTGFTYTVLQGPDGTGTVIGCVYIYPSEDPAYDVRVRSWVRDADADLDPVLAEAVAAWLADVWPFERPDHASRPEG